MAPTSVIGRFGRRIATAGRRTDTWRRSVESGRCLSGVTNGAGPSVGGSGSQLNSPSNGLLVRPRLLQSQLPGIYVGGGTSSHFWRIVTRLIGTQATGRKRLLWRNRDSFHWHDSGGGGGRRTFAGFGARVLRHVLKLRYWVAGGAVAGGVALGERYEEWKRNLPDLKWIQENEALTNMSRRLHETRLDWTQKGHQRALDMSRWAADAVQTLNTAVEGVRSSRSELALVHQLSGDSRLERTARQRKASGELEQAAVVLAATADSDASDNAESPPPSKSTASSFFGKSDTSSTKSSSSSAEPQMSEAERIEKLNDELLGVQSKYQHELERLEKDNKELRRQLLLKGGLSDAGRKRSKRSLIDMYSDVLDELTNFDAAYNTADNLPRVVVVGDQSSGKTSVLEMIAGARIFPRGSGEMMTRSPVKVTISEGPYHVAQFKDSTREFDLTKENELSDLRREIEVRMRNSVAEGKTVSNKPIALTVKGPGMPRMVLVDLPGVISTVTTDMASETKDDIVRICRAHMANPNAIILCIQDGSVDAERSNVTDLVTSMDPNGKRTILVLTKVDLAEENLTNPDRIKKILEGRLFPMKALGYFAVVTGKGNSKDGIDTIRQYEERFFARSKLFRDGVLKPSQMTTRSMSLAVSECFWRMVRESVAQQADAFRASRFNLETEWNNAFPRQRQLDRDELFERARAAILDHLVGLSQLGSSQWDELLNKKLWQQVSGHVFENIYIPAAIEDTAGGFNTLVDIKLRRWADRDLAAKSVQVGWETLRETLLEQMSSDRPSDHDPLYDPLQTAVLDKALAEHKWDEKAVDYLKVMQLNALDDRVVPDKPSWDAALGFMNVAVKDRLAHIERAIHKMNGPDNWEQWTKWISMTDEQRARRAIETELKAILKAHPSHSPMLKEEDFVVVRRNLANKSADIGSSSSYGIGDELIRSTWHHIYRRHFLQRASKLSRECKSFYYHYNKGFGESEVECQSVVLFWRAKKMIEMTASALRQQITNAEQRSLEKEIKEILEDWSQDSDAKARYLTGRRVELSEQLKKVRQIQEKLEEFIQALNKEKS